MHLYLGYQTHDWFNQDDIDKLNLFRIAAFTMHYHSDISHATGNLGATRYIEEHEKKMWFPNLSKITRGESRQENSGLAGTQGETSSRNVTQQVETEQQQIQSDLYMDSLRELYRTQVPDHSFSTRNPGTYGHPSFALASTDAASTATPSTAPTSTAPTSYAFAPYDPSMIGDPFTASSLADAFVNAFARF